MQLLGGSGVSGYVKMIQTGRFEKALILKNIEDHGVINSFTWGTITPPTNYKQKEIHTEEGFIKQCLKENKRIFHTFSNRRI